ncbi:hypothetical protein LguiB_000144 [Lonicera macranthoides]
MESEKKRERSDESEAEREQAWGLVRCSTEKEERKKSKFRLFKPLIDTVTKSTTTTTSITIITPPENPNRHINLYLCIRTDIDAFSWIKLDPTNTTTTPTVAKPKSSSNSCNLNSKGNKENNKKKKNHRQQQRILLTPISDMPPTTPRSFRAIPHSPSENQKLVYAFGGQVVINGERSFSSKAFVCDFASTTNPLPVWEELPSMPSQLDICMGVASPLDGNVYAFGVMHNKRLSGPYNYVGLVFDPSSRTWNQCSHPFHGDFGLVKDYALVHSENNNSNSQLVAFTYHEGHTFNLTNALWENSFSATVPLPVSTSPDWNSDPDSTSVAVGHLIYKYIDRKLFALDTSSPEPSFEPVHGLDNKLPTYSETYGNAHMVYLSKGKLCIIWGDFPNPSENLPVRTLSITCLKLWVGMCNRRNRLQAIIDRCERFLAHGICLYDVIAF